MFRCAIVCICMLVNGFGQLTAASAQAASCLVVSLQYALTCYAASDTAKAEATFPGLVINPTPAVTIVTTLGLTHVITAKRVLPTPSKRVVALEFVYGPAPDANANGPGPFGVVAKWVTVTESTQHFPGIRGIVMHNESYSVPGAVQVWDAEENPKGSKLGIMVSGNEPKRMLRRIARELRRAALKQSGVHAGTLPE